MFDLLEGQKSISGSAIGSNAEMKGMFHFCAKHAIMPMIEVYPMKEVNQVLNVCVKTACATARFW